LPLLGRSERRTSDSLQREGGRRGRRDDRTLFEKAIGTATGAGGAMVAGRSQPPTYAAELFKESGGR
jgi:hypothetical protein